MTGAKRLNGGVRTRPTTIPRRGTPFAGKTADDPQKNPSENFAIPTKTITFTTEDVAAASHQLIAATSKRHIKKRFLLILCSEKSAKFHLQEGEQSYGTPLQVYTFTPSGGRR